MSYFILIIKYFDDFAYWPCLIICPYYRFADCSNAYSCFYLDMIDSACEAFEMGWY